MKSHLKDHIHHTQNSSQFFNLPPQFPTQIIAANNHIPTGEPKQTHTHAATNIALPQLPMGVQSNGFIGCN